MPDLAEEAGRAILPSVAHWLRQTWSQLSFLHWEVPAERLAQLLPPGLTLDTYEGRAFVGLVPFTMSGIRPPFLPALPWLSAFHETNVRTYVRVPGHEPGVYFFSLEAANPVAVLLARSLWRLPYQHARMTIASQGASHEYRSERLWPGPRPARSHVRVSVTGGVAPARQGSLEHFLVERYWLYTGAGDRISKGRVHHTAYPLQPASALWVDENLVSSAGIERPDSTPLAHFASGVEVWVDGLEPV